MSETSREVSAIIPKSFKAMAKIAQTRIANKSNKSNFDPIESSLDLVY